jgi:hypothetical protein
MFAIPKDGSRRRRRTWFNEFVIDWAKTISFKLSL